MIMMTVTALNRERFSSKLQSPIMRWKISFFLLLKECPLFSFYIQE